MNNLMLAVILPGFGAAAVYEFFDRLGGRWALLIGSAGAVILWLAQ